VKFVAKLTDTTSSYFDGTRDGLKKNIVLRTKWDLKNKIRHYKNLMTSKARVDNKLNLKKGRHLKGLSRKDRLTFDRSAEIYKDNLILLGKLREIQVRSNSSLSNRSKSTSKKTKR